MLSVADPRPFAPAEERFQRCLYCGKGLVVLHDDRRGGACFDCLSILELDRVACAECGTEIPSEGLGPCPRCGGTRSP